MSKEVEEYLDSLGFKFKGGPCKKDSYTIYFKEFDDHYIRITSGNMQIFKGHIKTKSEFNVLLHQLGILN